MKTPDVSAEILLQVRGERQAIAEELPEMELQDARLTAAASEDTLCGHLRQAIHASHKSLNTIALQARIDLEDVCGFLEGRHVLGSDALDRLAAAAGVVVTVSVARS
jgi:hypothetical protein